MPLAVDDRGAVGPRLVVYPNRLNPFTHGTVISFAVREASAMRVRIFDAAGRLAAEPPRKTLAAGTHQVEWNGVGNSRQRLPAGMYVYEVRSASDVRRDEWCCCAESHPRFVAANAAAAGMCGRRRRSGLRASPNTRRTFHDVHVPRDVGRSTNVEPRRHHAPAALVGSRVMARFARLSARAST